MSHIICFDAGFTNLGYMVARLPKYPGPKPTPVDFGVSSAPLPKKGERARRVTDQNILRINKQVDTVRRLHKKYKPVAYFAEMPHGGAKGAPAIRGMAYSVAYLSAAIRLLALRKPFIVFLPGDVKKAVTGKRNADKLAVAQAVLDYWPEIQCWPGFKIITVKECKDGEPVVAQRKALAHDATDAGAVCITATQHESYLRLFYGKGRACPDNLEMD